MPELIYQNEKRALLNVRYGPDVARVVRMLEGRKAWLKTGGVSLFPSEYNLGILRDYLPALACTGFPSRDASVNTKEVVERPYGPIYTPYPLQSRALESAEGRQHFAFFMEQGTGKSKVALDHLGRLWSIGAVEGAVIVAPKGVHHQWYDFQVPEHFGGNYHLTVLGRYRGVPGTTDQHCKIYVTSYSGMRTVAGRGELEGFTEWCGPFMLILDESHFIKNHKSQRWDAVYALSRHDNCVARVLLTGTPIAKDLVDEWSQFKVLDENIIGIEYVTSFRRRYCDLGGYTGWQVIGHKNLDEFKRRTSPHIFRARKDELGISAKQYTRHAFSMSILQRREYDRMKSELLVELETGTIEVRTVIQKLGKLQQLSNGFVIDSETGKVHNLFTKPKDNPRIEALLELLEASDNDDPVIIWCRFRQDIANIVVALGVKRCAQYHGGVSPGARTRELQAWRDGRKRFFVSNPSVGGTGLNLQGKCTQAIYYSNSENSIDRWQSEDRIHRIGTIGTCTYVDLMARGSRDPYIFANLRNKKDLSDLTLDDIRSSLMMEEP